MTAEDSNEFENDDFSLVSMGLCRPELVQSGTCLPGRHRYLIFFFHRHLNFRIAEAQCLAEIENGMFWYSILVCCRLFLGKNRTVKAACLLRIGVAWSHGGGFSRSLKSYPSCPVGVLLFYFIFLRNKRTFFHYSIYAQENLYFHSLNQLKLINK